MSEAYDELPILEFWNVSRTSDELNLSPTSLKKVRPLLHVLQLPRKSYLFPSFYTTLFHDMLGDRTSSSSLQEPARILADTTEARRTIELEEDILASRLRDETLNDLIFAQDLRKILGISYGTITDWHKREDMVMIREGKRLRIPTVAVIGALTWGRPEGMPPAGPVMEQPAATSI